MTSNEMTVTNNTALGSVDSKIDVEVLKNTIANMEPLTLSISQGNLRITVGGEVFDISKEEFDPKELLCFVTSPFVRYDLRVKDDGGVVDTMADYGDFNYLKYPYSTAILDSYKKPALLTYDDFKLPVQVDTEEARKLIQGAILNNTHSTSKGKYLKIQSVYVGIAYFRGKVCRLTAFSGKYNLFNKMDKMGPEAAYERMSEMYSALKALPSSEFCIEAMDFVMKSPKAMYITSFEMVDLLTTDGSTFPKRGSHLAPIKGRYNLETVFSTKDKDKAQLGFEVLSANIEPIITHPMFRSVAGEELNKLVVSMMDKRHVVQKEVNTVEASPVSGTEVAAPSVSEDIDSLFSNELE